MARTRFDPASFDVSDLPIKEMVRFGLILVGLLIVAGLGLTSFYTVQANEEAVVLRFGKYLKTSEPGLHFKLPLGIDRVEIGQVKAVLVEEFGFRTRSAGVRSEFQYGGRTLENEGLMLTADLNLAEVHWVVRYKIKNLKHYLFEVQDVRASIRDTSEAVMRRVVGDRSIDEVLTIDRIEIENEVQAGVQELLDEYKCGVFVERVSLKSSSAPDEVKDAFNAVNRAMQMRDKIVNEAEGEKNRVLPAAAGKANRMIKEAEGYEIRRVNEAEGDKAAFLSKLEAYEQSKDVTRRRLYLETLGRVLPQVGRVYLVDQGSSGLYKLLDLGRAKEGK